jgi:hypothetical protein
MIDGQDHGVDSQHTDQAQASKDRRCQFEEHIRRWRSSGLTQAEYCRRNGLKCSTFHYWRRRLGTTSQAVTLVQVPVGFNGGASGTWGQGLTLILADRYKVEIGDNFNASTLARLVDTLGQWSW